MEVSLNCLGLRFILGLGSDLGLGLGLRFSLKVLGVKGLKPKPILNLGLNLYLVVYLIYLIA